MTQAETNPFPYSDSNKRYYTYDYYLKKTYGGKVAKLALDAGFTCPNVDGRCGRGGCIYCSGRGSGDFAPDPVLPIGEQIRIQKQKLSSKWDTSRSIAYFQAHTNTYAPVDRLDSVYSEALAEEGIVGINIATRADCLGSDVLTLLRKYSEKTRLTVELGLQSSKDETAVLINRGHLWADFVSGFTALRREVSKAGICIHLIFGLPGETHDDMMRTVRDVARLHPDQVKIHLLHVLRGTRLAQMYEDGAYLPMERSDYIRTVVDALELLPPDIVIARLTGDGAASDLLSPLWSMKKTTVVNDIDKEFYARGTWQGCKAE